MMEQGQPSATKEICSIPGFCKCTCNNTSELRDDEEELRLRGGMKMGAAGTCTLTEKGFIALAVVCAVVLLIIIILAVVPSNRGKT